MQRKNYVYNRQLAKFIFFLRIFNDFWPIIDWKWLLYNQYYIKNVLFINIDMLKMTEILFCILDEIFYRMMDKMSVELKRELNKIIWKVRLENENSNILKRNIFLVIFCFFICFICKHVSIFKEHRYVSWNLHARNPVNILKAV